LAQDEEEAGRSEEEYSEFSRAEEFETGELRREELET
jgi:hypothetical protein